MNINVVYFSPTESTAKITKQISAGLGWHTKEYNITLPQKRTEYRSLAFSNNDLVIVGVPVYGGRIPEFLEDYLSGFKGDNTLVIFSVVYGNRDYEDALLELKNIFETSGFKSIAAGAFIGEHSYTEKVATDRPDVKDLDRAFQFGQEIKLLLNSPAALKEHQLIVKGNFPYKERKQASPMVPQTNERCIDCGICAENCPMDAIDSKNTRVVNAEKCIHCCSCVKKCPENAKAFNHEAFFEITQRLIRNCVIERKEPELFI